MQTEIKKWGNSAVVRIPAPMLAELRLVVGSPIELRSGDDKLIIKPIRPARQGWFNAPIQDESALAEIPIDEDDDEWQW